MSHVNVTAHNKGRLSFAQERPALLAATLQQPYTQTSHRAFSSPLFSPPPEIISRIIELGAENDTQFATLVSHVSGMLRDVALANPTFWNDIHFAGGEKSYDELRCHLERSKDAPLNIDVSKLESVEDAETMVALLTPHLRRWKQCTLELWDGSIADVVFEALKAEAPILETLSIVGSAPGPYDLFSGKAPSLRSLTVKGISLNWSSPIMYNLTYLSVHSASWTAPSLLAKWQSLQTLIIRADPLHPLAMDFSGPTVALPDLNTLEINGVTEADVVRLLAFIEMPTLDRLLFTHIKDSSTQVIAPIMPLASVRHLRLHATEMCQDNLLNVLRKVRNLQCLSFEDSSPIPSFIAELTQTNDVQNWICPRLNLFKVIAFEKDNAHRTYDDSDIVTALKGMMEIRRNVEKMAIRMCVFAGERDDVTRHAADWNEERPYKSEKHITMV